jgi:hypothetical protein
MRINDRIEAAAKAICDTRHYPDQEAWINMPDDLKEIYRRQASAALAAADTVEARRADELPTPKTRSA